MTTYEILKQSHDALQARVRELEAELAKLNDPVAVHINMLLGTIATPSPELMQHVWHGEQPPAPTYYDRPDKPLWMPCRHKLPKAGARVLAMFEGVYSRREVTVWYDAGNNVHFGLPSEPDGKGSQPATHWMPLPATPPPPPAHRSSELAHARLKGVQDAREGVTIPPPDFCEETKPSKMLREAWLEGWHSVGNTTPPPPAKEEKE